MNKVWLALLPLLLIASMIAYASADSLTSSVAILGPDIIINSPASNSWHNESFAMNVTISGVATNTQYRYENSTANGTFTNLSYDGAYWMTTVGITDIANGNYTLRINASDIALNTDEEAVFVYVDNIIPSITSFTLSETQVSTGDVITGSCTATDNSENFGGSVSTVITGISTGSAGTRNATCTATDNADNSVSSNISYTVESSSEAGGSGGGGAAPAIEQETAIISAPETVTEVSIVPQNLDTVLKVVLSLNRGLTSVLLDIKTYSEPLAGIGLIDDPVYQFLEVTTDAPEGSIKSAKIQFKVERSWLESMSAPMDAVELLHYKNGEWLELPTNKIDADANYIYYEAETDSFSLFAIALSTTNAANLITGGAIAISAQPSSNLVVLLLTILVIVIIVLSRTKLALRKKKQG